MNGPSEFYAAVQAEDDRLEQALAGIRRRLNEGAITVRQAADERITVLEAHLAAVRSLRRRYFGDEGELR